MRGLVSPETRPYGELPAFWFPPPADSIQLGVVPKAIASALPALARSSKVVRDAQLPLWLDILPGKRSSTARDSSSIS